MEFATPGHEGAHEGRPDAPPNGMNLPLKQQQEFGGTVSVSSSGNSGNFSQSSASSSLPGIGGGQAVAAPSILLPQQQLVGAPQQQQQQQPVQQQQMTGQQVQPGIPVLFNPLQIAGIPAALAPAFPLGTNAGDASAATIGVPLSAPAMNGAISTSGQKRKSETDLSQTPKEQRAMDTFETSSFSGKGPPEKDDAELEKMNPAERRRYERNLREQQRSYRISQQIKQLRDVLEESKIPFKPNKFSTSV